ncbi:MAG: threonine synthase [Promethearchaeia archaeon]
MVFVSRLVCTECGDEFDAHSMVTHCSGCGGVLQVGYDSGHIGQVLQKEDILCRPASVWKYHELLPLSEGSEIVTLGEGGTPLHTSERIASSLGCAKLYLKDETTNPTGAFIDRGTAVEISVAREFGIKSIHCASSGNLAASLVAYGARAAIHPIIHLPRDRSIDMGKLYQIIAFGAEVEVSRNHKEAMRKAKSRESHSRILRPDNPWFLEGLKTTGYEISDQLGWSTPDWLIVPMGNGGHLSMIWKGLKELHTLGFIERLPRLVGTQAEECAPIVNAFQEGLEHIEMPTGVSEVAMDISMRNPSCGKLALQALKESDGLARSVPDEDMLAAVGELAKKEGVFAEPASATTLVALRQLCEDDIIGGDSTVVCVITGMGLKYPEVARELVKGERKLRNILNQVEHRKFTTKLGRSKLSILTLLSERESYGYQLWKDLAERFGIEIRVATVYQHLKELEEQGLLTSTKMEQAPRKTKYYTLTEKGEWSLEKLGGFQEKP